MLEKILDSPYNVKDYLLLKGDLPIAVVNPSILYYQKSGQIFIVAPEYDLKLSKRNDPQENLEQLREAKVIFFGKHDELEKAQKLLTFPDSSRTATAILNQAKNLRQFLLFFEKARTIRFGVLGCGGIGSNVTTLLAGLGCINFLLVDGDRVELSNLNRQTMFKRNDVGELKVKALKREILNRFNYCKLETVNSFVSPEIINKVCKTCDVLIVTADTPLNLFNIASDIAGKYSKPVFGGGYILNYGRVFYSNGKVNRKNSTRLRLPDKYVAPSSGPINYEVSALICFQLISYLLGNRKKSFRYNWDVLKIPRQRIY